MSFYTFLKRNKRIIGLLISIIFLIIVIFSLNLKELFALLSEIRFLVIVQLFGIVFIILILRAIRWIILVKTITKSKITLVKLLRYSFQSQFYNSFFFNGVGDIIKVLSIKTEDLEIDISYITTMTIIDRILDVLVITIGGFISLILLDIFSPKILFIICISAIAVIISIIIFLYFSGIYRKLLIRFSVLKLQLKLIKKSLKVISIGLVVSLFLWVIEGIKIFFITNQIANANLSVNTSILVGLSGWLGTLFLLPISGSLGTKEYFLSLILKNQNISSSKSSIISLFDRAITFFSTAICFLFSLLIVYLQKRIKLSNKLKEK